MTQRISSLVGSLLDWLVPRNCLGCSSELAGQREWCGACGTQLEVNSLTQCLQWPLLAPWRFAGPLRHAIHRLKYEERSDFAARLVADGFRRCPGELQPSCLLVPVPLHPNRLIERGYNQSALLARALGKRWRLPVAFDWLTRCRQTTPQVGQSREQRAVNVSGAFFVDPHARAQSEPTPRVWLVDDVVTTGATARACAAALEAAGWKLSGVVALAHARTLDASDGPLDA